MNTLKELAIKWVTWNGINPNTKKGAKAIENAERLGVEALKRMLKERGLLLL